MSELKEKEKAIADRWSLIRGALNEAQRRLWLGVEAHVLGSRDRGVSAVARATKASPITVADGLALLDALLSGTERPDEFHPHLRVRRKGAGRKPLRERLPDLLPTLMKIVEPKKVLSCSSPLLWVTRTRDELVKELGKHGFQVSGSAVFELLREEGFRVGRAYNHQSDASRPQPFDQFTFVSNRVALAQREFLPVVSMELLRISRAAVLTDGAVSIAAGLRRRPDDRFDDDDPKPRPDAPCEVCGSTRHRPGDLISPSGETIDLAAVALEQWWKHEVDSSSRRAARLVVVVAGLAGDEKAMRQLRGQFTVVRKSMQTRLEVLHLPEGISRWRNVSRKYSLATNDYVVDRSLERQEVLLQLPGGPFNVLDCTDSSQPSIDSVSQPNKHLDVDVNGFAKHPIWNYSLADD